AASFAATSWPRADHPDHRSIPGALELRPVDLLAYAVHWVDDLNLVLGRLLDEQGMPTKRFAPNVGDEGRARANTLLISRKLRHGMEAARPELERQRAGERARVGAEERGVRQVSDLALAGVDAVTAQQHHRGGGRARPAARLTKGTLGVGSPVPQLG